MEVGILHTLAVENLKWMVVLLFLLAQGFLNLFRITLLPVTSSEIGPFISLFVFIAVMSLYISFIYCHMGQN